MDGRVRDYFCEHFSFRYVETPDYASAMRLEAAIMTGRLGQLPHLDPASR
jgi:hypothetical protein